MSPEELENRYATLLAWVKCLPPMTWREKEEQRFDWVYGNLAATTNHHPTRDAFETLARIRGWDPADFERWAADREWRT